MKTFALFMGILVATSALADSFEITVTDPLHPELPPKSCSLAYQRDSQGVPTRYSFHLQTETCFDGKCKPIDVTLHWDAFGRYEALTPSPNLPLTKKEHEPFQAGDYTQLDRILSDRYSILGRHPLNHFVATKHAGTDEIDAVSAPTPVEVQAAVVPGAAYTSWVLWHWVNGPVAEQLRDHTASEATPEFLERCLVSHDAFQVHFALQVILRATPPDPRYAPICIRILEREDRRNCLSALRYLELVSADLDALSLKLVPLYGRNDASSHSIYRHFETRRNASPVLWIRLAEQLPRVSPVHQVLLVDLLERRARNMPQVRKLVAMLLTSDDRFVARRARQFFSGDKRTHHAERAATDAPSK